MLLPQMQSPRRLSEAVTILPAVLPVPGLGVLPVNSFVVHGPRPLLVDTGLAALRAPFLEALRSVIDPAELEYVWLTHADADHFGNLSPVLHEAPAARLVTTFLGMGKLSMLGLPVDRALLLNPGQDLDLGDRRVRAVAPPLFDAPETVGLYDPRDATLFSADAFGCLMAEPAEDAADIPAQALRDGMTAWARVDAPWLSMIDARAYAARLDEVRWMAPRMVLSSHLPPATHLTATLLDNLAAARTAPAFTGPDQAALERMMAAAA